MNVKRWGEGERVCLPLWILHITKISLLHGCFTRFLDSTNGTKLRNVSDIYKIVETKRKIVDHCVKYARMRVFCDPHIPL